MQDNCRVQIRHHFCSDIEPEFCATIDLRRCINAPRRLANDSEIPGVFQLYVIRRGQQIRSLTQSTVILFLPGRADHVAVLGAAIGGVNLPFGCGGCNQHRARRRTNSTHLHPGIDHRRRAAGHLHAKHGVRKLRCSGRQLGAHFAPVAIEFFGHQHRQRGHHTLAKFKMLHLHRDRAVARNAQKCIRCCDGLRRALR